MHTRSRFALSSLLLAALTVSAVPASAERPDAAGPSTTAARDAAWQRHQALDELSAFKGLEWRNIGPVIQGGRVVDIEAVPGKPYSFLVAYASGGVWRTDDNGVNFEPIFDDEPVQIIGDVAIDPSNGDSIWVGTGENNSSRSSYGGVGVFHSADGGKTWTRKGLEDTDRIGRIVVDPRDSKRVYVGSLGKLYTPGGGRGVYRTKDGGETWEQVLATSGEDGWTGIIDLVMDPSRPDVLYAAAWHRTRSPWDFVESGAGSGIYKSTDGGDTWTRLEGGFPSGEFVGRIGLAIAASQPDTLYASVDHQEALPEEAWDLGDSPLSLKRVRKMDKAEFLSHSKDDIEDFIQGNDLDTELDADTLIQQLKDDELSLEDLLAEISDANANLFNTDIRGLEVYRSDDGGTTWKKTHDEPIRDVIYTYGYYFGQIRVSPKDPDQVYALGVPAIQSADGGKTWKGMNYRGVHVDYQSQWIDPEFPERMWIGNDGGIDASYDGGKTWIKIDNQPVGQFYSIAVDMEDPYNVYGGLQDNGTLKGSSQSRPGIDKWRVIGGGDGMYVQIDPRDGTLYTGFQFGFYFRSDGQAVRPRDKMKEPALRYNWQTPIQLSSHNADVLYYGAQALYRSMDRGETWTRLSDDLTRSDQRGDVPFATITTLDESTERFGLVWVGTDDGQVWVTRDGGVEWSDVGAGLPADRWVSRVEASVHEENRAYLSLNGYRQDDITAYVYVTEDLGKTWTSLAAGLPAEAVNVVREDPVNADVLYVGTDRGVYVSLDRGANWQGLPSGLPNVPVHDLVIHPRERELVAGTHGRSIYILDALPIQEAAAVKDEAVHVFPLEDLDYDPSWQGRPGGWFEGVWGEDPELEIPFWSKDAGPAVLTVLDGDGRELRRVEMTAEAGVNTFVWDLLLDQEKGLAAEKEANTPKDDKKKKKKKKAEEKTGDQSEPELHTKAKWPRAEAARLGWKPYVTPGDYTLKITVGEGAGETDLSVSKPDSPRPRTKKKPKIRGQKDD